MENLKIETTRNVDLEYKIAGIGDRILAYLIDSLIIGGVFLLFIVFIMNVDIDNSIAGGILLIVFSFAILYHLLMETLYNGQSIGKRIRKIRVVKIDGTAPTFGSYLLRWVLRLIDITFTSGALAIITIIANGKGQRLGDMAANTTVIKISDDINFTDTVFSNVSDSYQVVYKEVSKLNDEDIALAQEILRARTELEATDRLIQASYTAKEKFEKKMGISSDMHPVDFFNTIIKDYNKVNGVV